MFRILAFLLLPVICLAQVNSNGEKPTGELLSNEISPDDMKRNTSFNLDEIKVRWKKAALENCTGVPCIITPPPPPPPPPAPSFTCVTSTVSDVDGNIYNTVSIGTGTTTQCWTATNLKVTKYNDGVTQIPLNNTYTSGTVSTAWQILTTGAYTIYGNEASTGANASNYGFLYNWYAAAGIVTPMGSPTKNICPVGWHVPSDTEWTTLTDFLSPPSLGISVAGGKLKSPLLWALPSLTDGSSGFNVLPGGSRYDAGDFYNITYDAEFWSATQHTTSTKGWSRNLSTNHSRVDQVSYIKSYGFSVRCLRD